MWGTGRFLLMMGYAISRSIIVQMLREFINSDNFGKIDIATMMCKDYSRNARE
jgi:hypothetical protein